MIPVCNNCGQTNVVEAMNAFGIKLGIYQCQECGCMKFRLKTNIIAIYGQI